MPALLVVLQVGPHDLVAHLLMRRRIEHRRQRRTTPVEIPRHQVGGGNVDRCIRRRQPFTTAETIDARMLEKASDNALHPNPLWHPRHARPKATDPAHDEVDFHPRLARLVERLNDLSID